MPCPLRCECVRCANSFDNGHVHPPGMSVRSGKTHMGSSQGSCEKVRRCAKKLDGNCHGLSSGVGDQSGKTAYQCVGSKLDSVRKQAVLASPMSTMVSFLYLSRKWGGMSSGMGGAIACIEGRASGTRCLMVATRLSVCPSHQHGTMTRLIPFSCASDRFTSSRSRYTSNDVYA